MSIRKELEDFLGLRLYEYDVRRCLPIDEKEIKEWIREAIMKDKSTFIRSGDTTVIYLKGKSEHGVWANLWIITRGKTFELASSLSKSEIRKLKKRILKPSQKEIEQAIQNIQTLFT